MSRMKIYDRDIPPGDIFTVGDVLLLGDGRMARLGASFKPGEWFYLEFIDGFGRTLMEDNGTLDIERNLGQSVEILATFYAMHSLHQRLNNHKLFE